MENGAPGTHFFFGALQWQGPFGTVPWNYNIICANSRAPRLSNLGDPKIGTTFQVVLSDVRAGAYALFAIGVGKLDLDLSGIGAPGCRLLTNPLLVVARQADSSGTTAVSLEVPNDRSLIGLQFVNQFAVHDQAANALQFIFSNAGLGRIGT